MSDVYGYTPNLTGKEIEVYFNAVQQKLDSLPEANSHIRDALCRIKVVAKEFKAINEETIQTAMQGTKSDGYPNLSTEQKQNMTDILLGKYKDVVEAPKVAIGGVHVADKLLALERDATLFAPNM